MNYSAFLRSKARVAAPVGHECGPLNPALFPFQADIVRWAVRRGRACIWADCGLGKTLMQLEWARNVPGDVLILVPLAVAEQTRREGERFGIHVTVAREPEDLRPGINVTNYERLDKFDLAGFAGIVLDESSILKSYSGKTRNQIIEGCGPIPYRLACSATPAPNDLMELGNHSEFVGAMSRVEMLASFFVHDGGDTSQWRLRGHAQAAFWKWVASWAVLLRKPSDLGYSDEGFDLPALTFRQETLSVAFQREGLLFDAEGMTLEERRRARRESMPARIARAAEIINASDEQWVVWCDLNAESEGLTDAIRGALEITGSQSNEEKENRVRAFIDGGARVLVSKPSILGFGLNLQFCARMAFVGLSDSYEQMYQAVRRCWRFGQTRPVEVVVVTASSEGTVVQNIRRKEAAAETLYNGMVQAMCAETRKELGGTDASKVDYEVRSAKGDGWTLVLGDSCEEIKAIESDTVGFSIFSPPFASLYTYSASDRDMGNCANAGEFMEHFRFLIAELLRVTMPGRLLSFHCMNLPMSKVRDGEIGISDFRGELIRAFVAAGWIYHSEVVIWKDPVTAMQRTKALGLLHKQVLKDSCMSRQGIPDYLVTMRKPGVNPAPVSGPFEDWHGDDGTDPGSAGKRSINIWQRYASPVWMDINPNETLQKESAREDSDERHICPLQLQVIRRALDLWSNPGDLVLSPFAGIGSEGHEALKMGRRFIGLELKRSYWEQAKANLKRAAVSSAEKFLFTP
jgi:superfamily II DNA or RNA helicase